MSSEAERMMGDIQLDGDNLYREENITDLKVGSIRVLTPVKVDGSADGTRSALYMGQTQLVSQMGPLPVSCEIDATSLQEAIEKFPDRPGANDDTARSQPDVPLFGSGGGKGEHQGQERGEYTHVYQNLCSTYP